MNWFRMYAEVAHDPKVQRLHDRLFRYWINTLCCACQNGGMLPPIDDYAYMMRLSKQAAYDVLLKLKDADLIDVTPEGTFPHNWQKRQFRSDVSTDRVKRFRNAKKAVSETIAETEQKRPRARDTDTDTDTETPISPFFEKFWNAYPNKIGYDDAAHAWISLWGTAITPGNFAEVMEGLRRYKNSAKWAEDDGKYIPSPKTFLMGNEKKRGGMWKDYPPQLKEQYREPDAEDIVAFLKGPRPV